ncbi:hypothetical protein APHAL10511_007149 [Amanita phalloides]|nr:hypothetical protein APHAL10511_007149 [Amanita phalloides]
MSMDQVSMQGTMSNDMEKATIIGDPRGSSARHPLANPTTLGLFSFASSTFILALYNLQTRGITQPNVIVGNAAACGGLGQILAGMWEFPRGNTFGATTFTSYGAFWIAYAIILIPGSGARSAYPDVYEYNNAIGVFLVTWSFVTFFFCFAAMRQNVASVTLLALLSITLALNAAGAFTSSATVSKFGGGFGIVTAMCAYYIGLSELIASERWIWRMPLGELPKMP